ncbi:hypothetical protein BKA63DRAFT_198756 [Paraphoma chrysanthemicola]|nr:hypothetical protein BKA63DRAFT_198756 [Paraphoma chrysanthemicola]
MSPVKLDDDGIAAVMSVLYAVLMWMHIQRLRNCPTMSVEAAVLVSSILSATIMLGFMYHIFPDGHWFIFLASVLGGLILGVIRQHTYQCVA